ncbi:MAG: hypothetical protein KME08_19045 [Aphanothece sp. CMT-3BRIN-NPC111]|jgi:hypothetical protein|nr:hypothetical protein [Aphanothece sp. CMT-3BRIN-NPC111]
MLEAKLTTCANLLYQWILPRAATGTNLKVDLQDFQAWTGEYREKPFSDREILDALRQLKAFQLINVSKTEVTLEVNPLEESSLNTQSPAQLLLVEADTSIGNKHQQPPNRFKLFLRVISGSLILGLTSVVIGLALVQLQPEVLTTPDPWSVLGEKNIGSGD